MTILDTAERIPNTANDGIRLNLILTEILNRQATTSLIARKKKLSLTSSPNESIVKANPK